MADTVSVTCPECDKVVKIPQEMLGRKLRCKGCDETFVARAARTAEKKTAKKATPAAKKPAAAAKKAAAPEKKPAASTDTGDDDGKAYGLTEEYLGARCPECANEMEEGDILCVSCGYNTQTRERAESKSVEDITGADQFLWLLPGILSALGLFAIIGFDVWYCLDMDRVVGSEWYAFIAHPSIKLWLVIMSCWPAFYAIKFAIKRLIYENQPPERLTRGNG